MTSIMIVLVKFKTNPKIYIEITRYIVWVYIYMHF